jgi:hypothetical protein
MRRNFRQALSYACGNTGIPPGEVFREHGAGDFVARDDIDTLTPQEFFVEAIAELVIPGKHMTNGAICIAAINCLMTSLGQSHSPQALARCIREVCALTTEMGLRTRLTDWVYSNFPG